MIFGKPSEELRNLEDTVRRLEASLQETPDDQTRLAVLGHVNRIIAEVAHLRVAMGLDFTQLSLEDVLKETSETWEPPTWAEEQREREAADAKALEVANKGNVDGTEPNPDTLL